MSPLADTIDVLIEAPVVPSYSKIGYAIRKRLDGWRPVADYDLSGRVVAITGATSGLGEAAACQLARAGAHLVIVARHPDKAEATRRRLAAAGDPRRVSVALADMSDLGQIWLAADSILSDHDRLDALIHNAGSLYPERRTAGSGLELTVASHVVGPFLLTGLLSERLAETPSSRVLTMSSGGMYTAGLTVDQLQMDQASYRGAEQYARAKRAQVTLNEMWAERTEGSGIHFHALHPGWADTPGVETSLPGFHKVMGPLLRDPAQGADTLVWLTADDGAPLASNGRFWLDRRQRPIHRLPSTRRTDTPERRRRLWEWVSDQSGWRLPPGASDPDIVSTEQGSR